MFKLAVIALCCIASTKAVILYGFDNCTAHTSRGTLNLSPLGNTDGTPRFTGIKLNAYGQISVNWNPCFDYSEPLGVECDGAAACILVRYGPLVHRGLGSNADSEFGVYDLSDDQLNEWNRWQQGRLYLRYKATAETNDGALELTTDIVFTCGENSDVDEVIPRAADEAKLVLELKSQHACWKNSEVTPEHFNLYSLLGYLGVMIIPVVTVLKGLLGA